MAIISFNFPLEPDDAVEGEGEENQAEKETPCEVAEEEVLDGGVHGGWWF